MRAALNSAEALTAIGTENERAAGFVYLVFVFRVDDEIGEIKRTPDHHLTAIAFLPSLPSIGRTIERTVIGFDHGVDDVGIRRRSGNGNAAPRLGRQTLRRLLIEIFPGLAAICGFVKGTGAGGAAVFAA